MNKKSAKLLCFILAVIIFANLPVSPAIADSSGLTFLALNDRIPPDISMMPYYLNGLTYIRCDAFKELGVSYTYFGAINAAHLSSGSTQLVFYLDDGTCYDGNGNALPISATSMNGVVYVPVNICKFFNLTSSVLKGTGYGDLLRIKNGAQSLSDSAFMSAATSSIYQLYQDYTGSTTTAPPDPTNTEPPDAVGAPVYLCFIGVPTAGLMNTLKSYGVSAAFFVTADEARENPDMLRRIVGEGSTLGISCEVDTEAECEDAAAAIAEAAFILPTIITGASTEEVGQYAAENGLVFYDPQTIIPPESRSAAAITKELPKGRQASNFLLHSGENAAAILPAILQHLAVNGYYAKPLLETSV